MLSFWRCAVRACRTCWCSQFPSSNRMIMRTKENWLSISAQRDSPVYIYITVPIPFNNIDHQEDHMFFPCIQLNNSLAPTKLPAFFWGEGHIPSTWGFRRVNYLSLNPCGTSLACLKAGHRGAPWFYRRWWTDRWDCRVERQLVVLFGLCTWRVVDFLQTGKIERYTRYYIKM